MAGVSDWEVLDRDRRLGKGSRYWVAFARQEPSYVVRAGHGRSSALLTQARGAPCSAVLLVSKPAGKGGD